MLGRMSTPLVSLWLAGAVVTTAETAQGDLVWMHDFGDWGAWGAYAIPDSDFVIFSFGCTGAPGLVSFHVELPIGEAAEGDPAWLELRRNNDSVRFDGEVFFSEWHSEHQVIAHAPSAEETFEVLARFLGAPGSISVAAPGGEEMLAVDDAAAEALEVVRGACLGR